MIILKFAVNVVALSACLLVGVCGCNKAKESKLADGFLGDRATRILTAPDRAEVFRITADHYVPGTKETLVGYTLLATGKTQDKNYAERLSAVLRDDSSYEWNMLTQCLLNPGIAYRVWRGNESVVILLCFQCNEVAIINDESHPEKMDTEVDDPARPSLLALAKQAFPDDKGIQELK